MTKSREIANLGDSFVNGNLTSVAADVVGATELNVTGNGTTAQYLRSDADGSFTWATPTDTVTNQTITLSGDATGSGTTSIVVTVADDSHNHIISNVDGLQTALDAKLALAGGTMTGSLVLNQASSSGQIIHDVGGTGGGVYITKPLGGSYKTTTAAITGALAIKLPTQALGDNDMMSFWVDIYDYAGGAIGESLSVFVYGYTGANAWGNTGGTIISDRADRDYTIRFGNDGTRQIVYIGELASTWSYPQVSIRDLQSGYTTPHTLQLDGAWVVSFETAFGTIQQTSSTNYPVSNQWKTARTATVTLTGDVTGTVGASVDGTGNWTNSVATQIAANVVTAAELNVTGNGTTAQYLRSDADGSFTWATPPDTNTTYAVGNGGLTEINFTSADNTKLDGIETGATADQTAAEILTAIKTVDVNGATGLNAGTYDGLLSTQFLRSDASDSTSGTLSAATFNATSTVSGGFQGIDADTITTPSFTWAADLNTGIYRPTTDQVGITTGGVSRGIFSSAGLNVTGAIVASGNVTAYSDARLKTNVKTIDNALNKVSNMRGVYFDKDDKRNTGVIAQEIEKVLPEVVMDGEYKSVAYGNIVGVLIEAIKELNAKVEKLEGAK